MFSSKVTATLALLFDFTFPVTDNPFCKIFKTLPNDELTEPVIKSGAVCDAGVAVNSVTLIAGVAHDVKLYEPVPSAKIPKIVPNDELICATSASDAAIDDVVCGAPKMLYGESNPYPLVELLANRVG